MSNPKVIKLRLSLKGRPLRTFTFDQDLITLGRDPESDIFLDNPGISRRHVTIMRTPGGYFALQDLNSSNGTFMNGKRVQREYLTNSDQISVGKYTLAVDYAEDRRMAAGAEDMAAPAPGHTTMLSQDELQRLIEEKELEKREPNLKLVEPQGAPGEPAAWWGRPEVWSALIAGLVLGFALSRWI